MSLLQWCDEGPATVSLLANVEDAVQTMTEKNVGAVAVIDDKGIVAGMFTERDVLAKFALSGRDPRTTPVRGQRRTTLDPTGPALLRGQPDLGRQRLHARLRRSSPARGAHRRSLRATTDVPRWRHRLYLGVAACRAGTR